MMTVTPLSFACNELAMGIFFFTILFHACMKKRDLNRQMRAKLYDSLLCLTRTSGTSHDSLLWLSRKSGTASNLIAYKKSNQREWERPKKKLFRACMWKRETSKRQIRTRLSDSLLCWARKRGTTPDSLLWLRRKSGATSMSLSQLDASTFVSWSQQELQHSPFLNA